MLDSKPNNPPNNPWKSRVGTDYCAGLLGGGGCCTTKYRFVFAYRSLLFGEFRGCVCVYTAVCTAVRVCMCIVHRVTAVRVITVQRSRPWMASLTSSRLTSDRPAWSQYTKDSSSTSDVYPVVFVIFLFFDLELEVEVVRVTVVDSGE